MDLLICIGKSEDNLPLVLNVKRSRDLQPQFDALASQVSTRWPDNTADEILNSFRFALEKHAASSWGGYQIFDVGMQDSSTQEMYVTTSRLSQLTTSLLWRVLRSAKRPLAGEASPFSQGTSPRPKSPQPLEPEDEDVTDLGFDKDDPTTQDEGQAVSFGGLNRFLGISISDGRAYSVGKTSSNEWVEWHPYTFEVINKNFPRAQFQIGDLNKTSFSSYYSSLEKYCFEHMDQNALLADEVSVVLSRQSIGHVIAKVATEVARLHGRGRIHGDLKPSNILLTENGPMLIDGFNLQAGGRAPGWTPNWSAPEQIMREPITYAADIYSLGMLVAGFLSASLVGEVRKFKIPNVRNHMKEHDVFYNPSIFILDADAVIKRGASQWIAFAKSCLKFDSSSRPKSAQQFADQLTDLLTKYPVEGDIELNLESSGQIVAVTLIDGTKSLARMLSDS